MESLFHNKIHLITPSVNSGFSLKQQSSALIYCSDLNKWKSNGAMSSE